MSSCDIVRRNWRIQKAEALAREAGTYLHCTPFEKRIQQRCIYLTVAVLSLQDNVFDGWMEGKLANGSTGLFPDNFVKLVPNEAKKSPETCVYRTTVLTAVSIFVYRVMTNFQLSINLRWQPPCPVWLRIVSSSLDCSVLRTNVFRPDTHPHEGSHQVHACFLLITGYRRRIGKAVRRWC